MIDSIIRQRWSVDEVKILTDEWMNGSKVTHIAEELERTPQAVYKKVQRLGLSGRRKRMMRWTMMDKDEVNVKDTRVFKRRYWSYKEIEYLRKNCDESLDYLVNKLSRSRSSIRNKMYVLNIVPDRELRDLWIALRDW